MHVKTDVLSSAVDYDTHDAEPEMSTLVEWINPEVTDFYPIIVK